MRKKHRPQTTISPGRSLLSTMENSILPEKEKRITSSCTSQPSEMKTEANAAFFFWGHKRVVGREEKKLPRTERMIADNGIYKARDEKQILYWFRWKLILFRVSFVLENSFYDLNPHHVEDVGFVWTCVGKRDVLLRNVIIYIVRLLVRGPKRGQGAHRHANKWGSLKAARNATHKGLGHWFHR